MKTSIDVFYYSVPIQLHCLLNSAKALNKDDFKNFWEKIAKANEKEFTIPAANLYAGFNGNLSEKVIEGFTLSGYHHQVKVRGKQDTATMCYFGSWTINNLPILFEVCVPDDQ